MLDTGQDSQTVHAPGRSSAISPTPERGRIEDFSRLDDGLVQMVATVPVPTHVKRKGRLECFWVNPLPGIRLGMLNDRLGFWAALCFFGRCRNRKFFRYITGHSVAIHRSCHKTAHGVVAVREV